MQRSIMTYQRSSLSYDSIMEEEQQHHHHDEEEPLQQPHNDNTTTTSSTTSPPRRRQRRLLFFRSTTLIGLAVVATTTLLLLLLLLSPHIPSQQERDIAAAYDMPLWGSVRHIRQAVASTAVVDSYYSNNNNNNNNTVMMMMMQNNKNGVHDILKKHHLPTAVDKYFSKVPDRCEMTVVLVRHCEKKNIREHCDYTGYERSVYLASLFGTQEEARWPLPALIFAEGPGGRHNRHKMNFRELETVGPLAEKAGVSIDDSFESGHINEMTREILSLRPVLCGQTVAVSWKHSDMGHIARHLGCGPLQGCPVDYNGKTFDEVWQIKFVYTAALHSDRKSLAKEKHPSWHVFGSVQHENFDPLAFSKSVGDYPAGGTATGGRWEKQIVDIPERTNKDWKKVYWQATNVGAEQHHDDDRHHA